LITVTGAVADKMFGFVGTLAVIVVDPMDRPDTGTVTEVAPAGIITVAGTVATPVALELRLTVKPPAGAAPDRVSVRLPGCGGPQAMSIVGAVPKLNCAVTVTVPLPDV
jgi:hypothetical protein